ncbi:hypothetical protein OG21DRAFT_1140954 [Imleria badia]|nr:hypothetical protein OG21DRAFT_1140954 [Imleria badia]
MKRFNLSTIPCTALIDTLCLMVFVSIPSTFFMYSRLILRFVLQILLSRFFSPQLCLGHRKDFDECAKCHCGRILCSPSPQRVNVGTISRSKLDCTPPALPLFPDLSNRRIYLPFQVPIRLA